MNMIDHHPKHVHYKESIVPSIKTLATVATIGLITTANANAASFVADCTGCSMAQIQSLAPECSGSLAGGRYISDFDAGNLYYVCYTIDGVKINTATNASRETQTTIRYHWHQPNPTVENMFRSYYDVYQNNGHVKAEAAMVRVYNDLRPKIGLGDNGYMNAYDTVAATANNDIVLNWLGSVNFTAEKVSNLPGTLPLSPALSAAIVNMLNSIKTNIVSFDFKVKVEVVFSDGSSRDYTIDDTGNWSTVPNSARDAHGNPIPENYNGIANGGRQTYSFGGDGPSYDRTNFITTLTLYGVPVTNGGGGGGNVIGCVTASGETVCTTYKLN
jgi:hypothetical protein